MSPNPIDSAGEGARGASTTFSCCFAAAGGAACSSPGSGESRSDSMSPNPIDSAGDGARRAETGAAGGGGAREGAAKVVGVGAGAGFAATGAAITSATWLAFDDRPVEAAARTLAFSLSTSVTLLFCLIVLAEGAAAVPALFCRSPGRGRNPVAGVVLNCLVGRDGVRTPRAPYHLKKRRKGGGGWEERR